MWYSRKYHLMALLSGLLAGMFMWLYLSSLNKSQPVIVAATFIPKHQIIRPEMLKAVNAPPSPWDDLVVRDISAALGKIALVDLEAGEPLFRTRFAPADDWFRVRYDLAPGERAFFIPLEPERFPAGIVSTGDRVDVIAVNREGQFRTATVAMQGVKVIAANPEGERPSRLAQDNSVSSAKLHRNSEALYTGSRFPGSPVHGSTGLVVAVTHDEATGLAEFLENGHIYVVLAGAGGVPVH